jgi:hypothetical protein
MDEKDPNELLEMLMKFWWIIWFLGHSIWFYYNLSSNVYRSPFVTTKWLYTIRWGRPVSCLQQEDHPTSIHYYQEVTDCWAWKWKNITSDFRTHDLSWPHSPSVFRISLIISSMDKWLIHA